MKAIVVTDQAAGTAGMKLVERPEPQGASLASLSGANYGDVVVQVHASGFTGNELSWPSTWIDRLGRDRTPSIPGHELAGVVTALSYGTTGLSVGQRVFGLTDWTRDGTLAEYVAVEARNLAPLPGDVDFTVGAALVMPGLTAWQGLFEHGRLRVGQSVLVHGAAGVVGSMATQLAREAGAYVIGTGRAGGRQMALDFGAQEFVDLDNDALEDVGGVDLVFDVLGGDIAKRSAGVIRAGGTLVTIAGPTEARPSGGLTIDFVVVPDRAALIWLLSPTPFFFNTGELNVLLARRSGIFPPPLSSVTGDGGTNFVATADLNHDGKLDLVMASGGREFTSGSVNVRLGRGDETFRSEERRVGKEGRE